MVSLNSTAFLEADIFKILYTEQALTKMLSNKDYTLVKACAQEIVDFYRGNIKDFTNLSYINYCVYCALCNKHSECDLTEIPNPAPQDWLAYVRCQAIKLWAQRIILKDPNISADYIRAQQLEYEAAYLKTALNNKSKAYELIALYHLVTAAEQYNIEHLTKTAEFLDFSSTTELLTYFKNFQGVI